MKPTDYNQIATQYRESKLLGFRAAIEAYTLFQLAGDLKGLRVLDLACGDGIYAREARRRGAGRVVGVDLSKAMIQLAESRELSEQLGCSYQVGDALALEEIGPFDVVLGVWLLNYAQDRGQLDAMLRSVYRNLAPGGRFCGINHNPFNSDAGEDYRKYGFTMTCPRPAKEGAVVEWRFFNPDGSEFAIDNYHLTPATHAAAFTGVGFADFRWIPARLDPTIAARDGTFWDVIMKTPPLIAFEARRAN